MVEVSHASGISSALDVTSLLASVRQSSTGNQFNFDEPTGTWWFNLDSSSYAAPGTYTVKLKSGDTSKYVVSPNCTGTFVRKQPCPSYIGHGRGWRARRRPRLQTG